MKTCLDRPIKVLYFLPVGDCKNVWQKGSYIYDVKKMANFVTALIHQKWAMDLLYKNYTTHQHATNSKISSLSPTPFRVKALTSKYIFIFNNTLPASWDFTIRYMHTFVRISGRRKYWSYALSAWFLSISAEQSVAWIHHQFLNFSRGSINTKVWNHFDRNYLYLCGSGEIIFNQNSKCYKSDEMICKAKQKFNMSICIFW